MKKPLIFSALLTLLLALLAWSCEKDVANEMVTPVNKELLSERCDCPACPDDFILIDFDGETPETFISSVMTPAGPIGIQAINPLFTDYKDALVFDSENAPSWDDDLATADQSNVLIVSDNPGSAVRSEFYNDENALNPGILIEFDFSIIGPVTVFSIDYIDMDTNKDPKVRLYDENDVLLAEVLVPNLGNNSYQGIYLNETGVYRMEAVMGGSGAVNNLCFQPEYEDEGCTHTYGYWKTHSINGPAPYDPTWGDLPQGEGTPFFGTGYSYYEILQMPPKGGNAYLVLAHQWIAAELNALSGASIPPDVLNTWLAARDLLMQFEDDVNINKKMHPDERDLAIDYAEILDDYNKGELGPPHCED